MYDLRVHVSIACQWREPPKMSVRLNSASNSSLWSDELWLQRGHWKLDDVDEFVVATNKNIGLVSQVAICYSNPSADDRVFIKEVRLYFPRSTYAEKMFECFFCLRLM